MPWSDGGAEYGTLPDVKKADSIEPAFFIAGVLTYQLSELWQLGLQEEPL